MRTHSEFVNLIEKVLKRFFRTFVAARETRSEVSSRNSNVVREPHSERERVLSEHRDICNFFEMRSDQAVRGERVAQSNLSEAEYHTKHDLSWTSKNN